MKHDPITYYVAGIFSLSLWPDKEAIDSKLVVDQSSFIRISFS